MSWIEFTRLAPIAMPGRLAANGSASPVEPPQGGWNPYEVWLTRVRAPRVGAPGVGAPGVGAVDPGLNQPGVAGNVGGVARRSVRR